MQPEDVLYGPGQLVISSASPGRAPYRTISLAGCEVLLDIAATGEIAAIEVHGEPAALPLREVAQLLQEKDAGECSLTDYDLGRVIHAANCAYNIPLGDPAPDATWDALPQWHRDMVAARVALIRQGYGPDDIHRAWTEEMLSRGWVLGDIKDPAATPPTHPCLREYRELPAEQQRKDSMAIAIITSLVE